MNIPRIILSLLLIVAAGGSVAGATSAYFSDTEVSSGNTFTAGAIDLKIDNESYYNGVATSSTSWLAADLTVEKFFNFFDLKPADWGEDTISVHVDTNDAYLCANVTLTSDDDRTCNDPELDDDPTCAEPDADELDGELADLVNFVWWADDGDNVLEVGESIISSGPLGALTPDVPHKFTLADSDENIWTGVGGPVDGDTTYYIGKAWCFGDIAAASLPEDDYSGPDDATNHDDGAGNLAATPEDGGISCVGDAIDNAAQTDTVTADVQFDAVQARNNPNFQCEVTTYAQATYYSEGNYYSQSGYYSQSTYYSQGSYTIITDNFGDGPCLADIPGWDEDNGNSCVNGTVAAATSTTGDNTPSPDGGRFALIGNNGFICRAINATGLANLQLKYYWRGDSDADPGDTGEVQYYTSGACDDPTGLVNLATEDLTQFAAWTGLETINLPGVLDNTSFFIRFNQAAGNESFRVDGVSVTGN